MGGHRVKTTLRYRLAAVLAALSIPTMASAAVIVDTGPGSTPPWSLFNNGQGNFQYLAARFHLDGATVLTDVEGFIGGAGGQFTVGVASQSTSGPERPNATQFTQQATATATNGDWFGVHGVSWSLGAGDWWVFFAVQPNLGGTLTGYMPGSAPNQLGAEAFISPTSGGDWARDDDLGIGVRITDTSVVSSAAPEPGTWMLLLTGFGLAGASLRQAAGRRAPA